MAINSKRTTVTPSGRVMVWTRHGDQGWDYEFQDEIDARHAHYKDDDDGMDTPEMFIQKHKTCRGCRECADR